MILPVAVATMSMRPIIDQTSPIQNRTMIV
jgi:hypothetical protein